VLTTKINWRWFAATTLFFCAFIGLLTGVSLSERPDVVSSDALTKAYYSLGLFVMGGLDLGTPTGGPVLGRWLLWLSYFASPMLAASAILEAIIKTISPYRWHFHKLNNHIIVSGSGELTITYLKELRISEPSIPILIIDNHIDPIREEELKRRYSAKVIAGDITRSYFLSKLSLNKAKKVVLLGSDNFQNFETAHKILALVPALEGKIIVHSNSIRFMRSMAGSNVAKKCIVFNSYQLAASALVQQHLLSHFVQTAPKDVVVIAGFGLFGQTILEELQQYAAKEIDTIAVIGIDAKRRIQVVDEQLKLANFCRREIFEGNISHPEVWKQLQSKVDLANTCPIIILCTDSVEDNFRTSLWMKRKHPEAMVIARSYLPSKFAEDVGEQYNILNVSINQLVKDNFPKEWLRP
jgi:Trk K+ transport system NAD-binding subunit